MKRFRASAYGKSCLFVGNENWVAIQQMDSSYNELAYPYDGSIDDAIEECRQQFESEEIDYIIEEI